MAEKFELGKIFVTPGVEKKINDSYAFGRFVTKCIERFANCDWGDLPEEDRALNEESLKEGDGMIAGIYIYSRDNTTVWMHTSADRKVTTILFPEEY